MTSHSPASSPELPKPLAMACTECGMLCDLKEFHPFAACLMFKACRNSDTVRSNLNFVREYGSAAAAQAAWRPIAEAPKDGSGMLALWVRPGDSVTARNYALVEFVRGCWRDTESDDQVYTEPTYWQPLPTPPAAPTGEQA